MVIAKQLEDLKTLSAYYYPLDANKQYYYNLYHEAGGTKPFEEYTTEDVLELIANAGSTGSAYHFDLNDDNTIRWYSAKSGGGYQIDQAHGQFLRLISDVGTSVYIHYTQVYQPVDYVQENIDIMSLVLAVTFSNAAYNLACMEDYIRDAEIISAKLQELNSVYQKLTMLRSGSATQASTDYCAVDSSFVKELLEAGLVIESETFATGLNTLTPLLAAFDLDDGYSQTYFNWIVWDYDASTGKITNKDVHPSGGYDIYYNNKEVLKNIQLDGLYKYESPDVIIREMTYELPVEGKKNKSDSSYFQMQIDPKNVDEILKFLSLEGSSVKLNFNTYGTYRINGDWGDNNNPAIRIYKPDIVNLNGDYPIAAKDHWWENMGDVDAFILPMGFRVGGGDYDNVNYQSLTDDFDNEHNLTLVGTIYSEDPIKDSDSSADFSWNSKTWAKYSKVSDILNDPENIPYVYLAGRDLDSYMDVIREQIDTLNNQLQIPTAYISLESNDMSTCFDTATNILSNIGTQLQTITHNTRA